MALRLCPRLGSFAHWEVAGKRRLHKRQCCDGMRSIVVNCSLFFLSPIVLEGRLISSRHAQVDLRAASLLSIPTPDHAQSTSTGWLPILHYMGTATLSR